VIQGVFKMSSRILITGATGFIGRQLTHDLVRTGERVRILARDRRKGRALFGSDVEISVGDLGDEASMEEACRGVETLYHIGGIYRFGLRHRRELWRINVEGTDKLMRSAYGRGVAKVVHLSSGGLLKKNPGVKAYSARLDENDFPTKAPRFSSYKYTKWHSEQRALAWARRGLPVVIASTTCPIGEGDDGPTPTGQMVLDFLNRRFPFYCRTALNFIDVRDLSRGLQETARNGVKGRRYLLAHQNLWLKEFLDLLAQETRLSAPQWCLPNWAIFLAGAGGDMVELLNPHQTGARVCMETACQAEQSRFFDNTRTREELGWKPERSILESIRKAVDWFRLKAPAEVPEIASPVGSPVQ
jgi:dihydroflavonol-4-reductase